MKLAVSFATNLSESTSLTSCSVCVAKSVTDYDYLVDSCHGEGYRVDALSSQSLILNLSLDAYFKIYLLSFIFNHVVAGHCLFIEHLLQWINLY